MLKGNHKLFLRSQSRTVKKDGSSFRCAQGKTPCQPRFSTPDQKHGTFKVRLVCAWCGNTVLLRDYCSSAQPCRVVLTASFRQTFGDVIDLHFPSGPRERLDTNGGCGIRNFVSQCTHWKLKAIENILIRIPPKPQDGTNFFQGK